MSSSLDLFSNKDLFLSAGVEVAYIDLARVRYSSIASSIMDFDIGGLLLPSNHSVAFNDGIPAWVNGYRSV